MTYKEEMTKGQLRSGGSSTLIWALSIVAAVCFVFVVSCSEKTTIVESGSDTNLQNPPDPKPDDWKCHRRHCGNNGNNDSSTLYGFTIGEVYYNTHVDARIKIEEFSDGTVYVSIGINGSQQLSVDMDPSEVQKTIVDNPDWSRNTSAQENDR